MADADSFFQQAAQKRERYVLCYRRAVEKLSRLPNVAVEVLIQPGGRTMPWPFCLSRIDALQGTAEKPEVVRVVDEEDESNPMVFSLGTGLEVRQESLSWESQLIAFSSETFDFRALDPWLRRWLDPEETNQCDKWGHSGVVHDLAWALVGSQVWHLFLDFGTAPVTALEELLALLSAQGVLQVSLGRNDGGVV